MNKLKQARLDKGVRQEDVANATGFSLRQIVYAEDGTHFNFTRKFIMSMCQYYKKRPELLFEKQTLQSYE